MSVFSVVGSVIFFLFNLYNYKSLAKNILLRKFSSVLLLFFTLIFTFELAFFLHLTNTSQLLYEIAVYSIGFSFMAFCILAPCDLVLKFIEKRQKNHREILNFCFDCFVLLSIVLYVGYGAFNALYNLQITKREVKIKGLEAPLKIALISDTHIGQMLKRDFSQQLVNKINALKPDMVFIVGDFIDTKASNLQDSLDPFLDLNSTYGTFYVSGNHEYYNGINALTNKIKALNFNILENFSLKVAGVNIAGVNDIAGLQFGVNEPDFNASLNSTDPNAPTILLTHQPRSIKLIDKELLKSVDLILSGHTHGGQIFPFSLLVWIQQGYLYGQYNLSERTKLIITSGAGFWGPAMRIGSHSEIVELNLIPSR